MPRMRRYNGGCKLQLTTDVITHDTYQIRIEAYRFRQASLVSVEAACILQQTTSSEGSLVSFPSLPLPFPPFPYIPLFTCFPYLLANLIPSESSIAPLPHDQISVLRCQWGTPARFQWVRHRSWYETRCEVA